MRYPQVRGRAPRHAAGHATIRRGKMTDYGVHLREKQKVKHYYGVLERQFRTLFRARPSVTRQHRRDVDEPAGTPAGQRRPSVGLRPEPAQARQLVAHGHIPVNGRRVDIPSYLFKPGDVIRVKNRTKSLQAVQANCRKPVATSPISSPAWKAPCPRDASAAARVGGRFDPGADATDRRAVLEVEPLPPVGGVRQAR